MTDTERRDFWWNTVTGPHAVVLDASAALRDGYAVALKGGRRAVWAAEMRSAVEYTFKEHMSTEGVLMHVVNGDKCHTADDVGRWLLETFASPRQRAGYRSRSKTSQQEYLLKNEILQHRLIWVQLDDRDAASAWQSFVRAYPSRNSSSGLFVLEMDADAPCEDGQRIRSIDVLERISTNDLTLLNTFVLASRYGYSTAWREYVSTLAASVCYPDAALSAEMVEAADLRGRTVLDILELLESRHAAEDFADDHVLSLLRRGRSDEIEHRIWRAQIQTLFPRIEMERVDIINEWRGNVDRGLHEVRLEQFGERVERPEDMELGLLWYCTTHWKPDGDYIVYLPDRYVRDRIRFLHLCRNKLAHRCAVDGEELVELLDGAGFVRE
ncbi:MAG: hypothetical protein HDQ87_11645 [Clostridia bacterium]|nr:hypothetical protein [Clostridia bacterium]